MNTALLAIILLALFFLDTLAVFAVLRMQERSVQINNAYHDAYRRLREWSLHYVMNSKNPKEIEMIQQLLNKDHALIVEAHLKRKTRKVNMSKETVK